MSPAHTKLFELLEQQRNEKPHVEETWRPAPVTNPTGSGVHSRPFIRLTMVGGLPEAQLVYMDSHGVPHRMPGTNNLELPKEWIAALGVARLFHG